MKLNYSNKIIYYFILELIKMKSNFSYILSLLFLLKFVNTIKEKENDKYNNPEIDENEDSFLIDNEIIIKISNQFSNEYDRIVGKNGIISFQTDYNDKDLNIFNIFDIEEKTLFETIIVDNLKNEYKTKCRLFKPLNENLRLFCLLKGNLNNQAKYINFNSTFFEYNNKYNISIISKVLNLPIIPVAPITPFLYSDSQEIIFDNNLDSYNLKFKHEHYNNEILVLMGNENQAIIIDNCDKKDKELICSILKTKIESIFGYHKKICNLGILYENIGYYFPNDVLNIILNYENITKKDIRVEIMQLKESTIEMERYIAYETNVSLINNIITEHFRLNFNGKIKEKGNCFFKQSENTNLLILCKINSQGNFYLEKTDHEIKLDNINIIYNFIINPIKNNEIFNVIYGMKYNLLIGYPQILDFTQKDCIHIFLPHSASIFTYESIKLNPETDDNIKCENYEFMAKCKININHFKNKKSGYYNLFYKNFLDGYSMFYEINPFKIILPKFLEISLEEEYVNNNYHILGQNRLLYLVTTFNDTENLFNALDIENYYFKGNFSIIKDKKINIYEPVCNLWKPKNENIRIFCSFEENFEIGEHNIYFNKVNFYYKNDYYISINSESRNIRIKKLNTNISFIYSEKQELNIENDINIYNLKFKQKFYDNRPLYLYKNNMKSLRLNSFNIEKNEIIFNIKKDDLIDLLSYTGENFKLVEKHDTEGVYIFNSILGLTINYQAIQKEITITSLKLLTPVIAKNEFIVFETNIKDLPQLTSDYFYIESKQNEKINCIFKKNINQEKLLLLCNATENGMISLGKIKSTIFDKINILYKFIFEELENNEEFKVYDIGTKISYLNILELDFSKKEFYTIIYETEYPERLKGIQLNNESKYELDCKNKIWYKECYIDEAHFTRNGYYYTYHSNNLGFKVISYEVPPIKVILKDKEIRSKNNDIFEDNENNDKNNTLTIGIINFVIIIVIAVLIFISKPHLKNKNISYFNMDVSVKIELAETKSSKVQ